MPLIRAAALRPVLLLAGGLFLLTPAARGQTKAPPVWFQMGNDEINGQANRAVDRISAGISDIILALNEGRKRNRPVDPDLAGRAMEEMSDAGRQFSMLGDKFKGHEIDSSTIKRYGAENQYDNLMTLIQEDGYKQPVNWKSYMMLLHSITDRVVGDLRILDARQPNLGPQLTRAFLDLIAQKILLERIGAMSGIITVAMQ